MKIPRGRLVRSRVVSDVGTTLATALDGGLTGYAVLEPQEALLLGGETRGVLTFESGVPVLAYETTTDRGGSDALADLAVPGPYSVAVYELDPAALAEAHDADELAVPPEMPADRLAGDPDLAARTREAAPESRRSDRDDVSAVEAFLADEDKLAAIRERARDEARARAAEWGLTDQLADANADAGGGADARVRGGRGSGGGPGGADTGTNTNTNTDDPSQPDTDADADAAVPGDERPLG